MEKWTLVAQILLCLQCLMGKSWVSVESAVKHWVRQTTVQCSAAAKAFRWLEFFCGWWMRAYLSRLLNAFHVLLDCETSEKHVWTTEIMRVICRPWNRQWPLRGNCFSIIVSWYVWTISTFVGALALNLAWGILSIYPTIGRNQTQFFLQLTKRFGQKQFLNHQHNQYKKNAIT